MKKGRILLQLGFAVCCLVVATACRKNQNKESVFEPYDPSKPVQLTNFFPDSGGIATQVILKGMNMGTEAADLRVYFNKKRATVIRVIGDLAYVITPKLPGDTCVISVAIGKDSSVYGHLFHYKPRIQVSTITGTPHSPAATTDGTLVDARFANPYYLAVDQEKNILVGEWKARARLISEERNSVVTLLNTTSSGEMVSGTVNTEGTFFFPMNQAPYYYEFNPNNQWLARRITPAKTGGSFDFNGKYSFAFNDLDSMLYTINTNGDLLKINPKTRVATLLKSGILRDRVSGLIQVYLKFHPIDKHMLYFVNPSSMNPADGPIPGTDKIYRMDMRTMIVEDYAGTGVKGHEDGAKEFARFNNPCQIVFDVDGNLYVGDTDNYCVRKITPEGIVSTVAGTPGVSGYLDGPPDIALFNRFWGMQMDPDGTLYIADYYNRAIRKLTIE